MPDNRDVNFHEVLEDDQTTITQVLDKLEGGKYGRKHTAFSEEHITDYRWSYTRYTFVRYNLQAAKQGIFMLRADVRATSSRVT